MSEHVCHLKNELAKILIFYFYKNFGELRGPIATMCGDQDLIIHMSKYLLTDIKSSGEYVPVTVNRGTANSPQGNYIHTSIFRGLVQLPFIHLVSSDPFYNLFFMRFVHNKCPDPCNSVVLSEGNQD